MDYIPGGDISHWQGTADLVKARDGGWKYVYMKASQATWRDSTYVTNNAKAREAGLLRGAYHFLQWNVDPERQAEWFWNVIQDDPGELPLVCDYEWNPGASTPTNSLEILGKFMERLKALAGGCKLGIYTSSGFWKEATGGNSDTYWAQYELWVAAYSSIAPKAFGPWATWFLWQYTGNGDGHAYGMESAGVDLNRMQPDFYKNLTGKKGETKMWENNCLIAAFNKVDSPAPTSIDFAALKAAGIDAVILNLGTSDNKLNPDEPAASCINNPYYKTWFSAATAAGLRVLADYDVNVMIDSVNGYNGRWSLQHIAYMLSGGFKPAGGGGAVLLNLERNTWLEGGDNRTITCTSVNYGKGVGAIFGKIWEQEKLVPGVRTGRWFLDLKDTHDVTISSQLPWLDQGDSQVPLFLARWKKTNVAVTGNFHDVVADIPDPSLTDEQAKYLYFGNRTRWMGWELATVRHAAVKSGTAMATFRLILWRGTKADFDIYFNFPVANTDTTAPSSPGNLVAVAIDRDVRLSWSPATDNVQVTGYGIWRNGTTLGSVAGTSYYDTGLTAGNYTYEVDAFDAKGNHSPKVTVSVTVIGGGGGGEVSRQEFEALKATVENIRAAVRAFGDAV